VKTIMRSPMPRRRRASPLSWPNWRDCGPFPVVVQKVIACVSRPDFKTEQVRDLIEEDPALAARILRVANSVAFQTRLPCASIQDAIIRMGARAVTDLAAGMSAMTAFADVKGAGKAVREHCAGTAAIVRALAYRGTDGNRSGGGLLGRASA